MSSYNFPSSVSSKVILHLKLFIYIVLLLIRADHRLSLTSDKLLIWCYRLIRYLSLLIFCFMIINILYRIIFNLFCLGALKPCLRSKSAKCGVTCGGNNFFLYVYYIYSVSLLLYNIKFILPIHLNHGDFMAVICCWRLYVKR